MTALCSRIAVAVTICLNEHTCPLIGSAEYGGSMCACFMEFKYQTGNVCRSALSLSLGLSGVSYHPRPGVGCFIAGSCRLRARQQFCDLPVRVLSCGAALGAGGIPCPPPLAACDDAGYAARALCIALGHIPMWEMCLPAFGGRRCAALHVEEPCDRDHQVVATLLGWFEVFSLPALRCFPSCSRPTCSPVGAA